MLNKERTLSYLMILASEAGDVLFTNKNSERQNAGKFSSSSYYPEAKNRDYSARPLFWI